MIKKAPRKDLRGALWSSSCSQEATCTYPLGRVVHASFCLSLPVFLPCPSPILLHCTHWQSLLCAGALRQGRVGATHTSSGSNGRTSNVLFALSLPQHTHIHVSVLLGIPFFICSPLSVPLCINQLPQRESYNQQHRNWSFKKQTELKINVPSFHTRSPSSSQLLCVVRVVIYTKFTNSLNTICPPPQLYGYRCLSNQQNHS